MWNGAKRAGLALVALAGVLGVAGAGAGPGSEGAAGAAVSAGAGPVISPERPNVSLAEQRGGHALQFLFSAPLGEFGSSETYDLWCTVDGTRVTGCDVEFGAITVPPGQAVTVTVETGGPGSGGWVRLHGRDREDGSTGSGRTNVTVTAAPGPPEVTPAEGAATLYREDDPNELEFEVRNGGSGRGAFAVHCAVSGAPSGCEVETASPVWIAGGASRAVGVSVSTRALGSGTVTLTASTDGLSDRGRYAVTVDTRAGSPEVTALSSSVRLLNTAGEASLGFRVRNGGTAAGTYELECSVTNVAQGSDMRPLDPNCELEGDQQGSVTIAAGRGAGISVVFAKRAGEEVSGTATLTATLAGTGRSDAAETDVELYADDPAPPRAPQIVEEPAGTLTLGVGESVEVAYAVQNPNDDTLDVEYGCGGATVATCRLSVEEEALPGGGRPADAGSVTATIHGERVGSGTLTFTAAFAGSPPAEHEIAVTVTGAPGAPEVRPDGGIQNGTVGVESRLAFRVENPGTAGGRYALSCGPPGCSTWVGFNAASSVYVPAGGTTGVSVRYTPTAVGTVTVELEASLGGQSDGGTIRLSVAGEPGPPEVTPDGGRQTGEAGVESRLAFHVHNPGTAAGTYGLSCAPSGCGSARTVTVGAGDTEGVTVRYTPAATATVTLTAALGADMDDGTIVLEVGEDGVVVTPKGGVQEAELHVASRLWFTVENLGTAARTYTLDCTPAGCSESDGSVSVSGGGSASVYVDYTPSAYGTTTVSLTATRGSESDDGWIDLEVDPPPPPPPSAPRVTPFTATQAGRVGDESAVWYRVRNPGDVAEAYALSCEPAGCSVSASTTGTLAGGQGRDISVRYTPQEAGAVEVTLTAASAAGRDSGTTRLHARPDGDIRVTPAAGSAMVAEHTDRTQAFTVAWDGPRAANVEVGVRCEGDLSGCAVSPSSVVLGGADPSSAEVTVSYRAGATSTPPDDIVVRAEHAADAAVAGEGRMTVTATSAALTLTLEGANPGLEALRGECLILASGAGAIECDDYRIDYPLLPVTRMNVPRALSLLYTSGLASPKPVIGAANRIGFVLDRYLDRGDRVVDYEVAVRRYKDGAAVGPAAEAAGAYISLDRRGAFGRGWWPAGYERITPLAGGRLLWSGGDGSTRVYEAHPAAANTWVAHTRGRADTVVHQVRTEPAHYLDLSNASGEEGEYGRIGAWRHRGLTGRTKMTWAFRMRPGGVAGDIGGVFGSRPGSRAWRLGLEDEGRKLGVTIVGSGSPVQVFRQTGAAPLQSGSWHFVVVQFDGTEAKPANRLKVWVDGNAQTLAGRSGTGAGPALPAAMADVPGAGFGWGRAASGSPGFTGLLGETAIVGGVLTSGQRGDWRSGGIDFDHSALVAGYDWRGSLRDRSSRGNHLTGRGIGAGDYGSTRAYPTATGTAATVYVRKLIGGGEVRYDASGRHEATVDRSGNETRFVHETVAGEVRLTAIRLPRPGGWDDAYRFGYDASGRLASISVLGGDGTFKVYSISTTSTSVDGNPPDGYTIDAITAPDGRVTRFGYSARGDGMLERVTDARGAVTEIAYAASKVSRVRVLTPNDAAIPAVTMTYQASRTVGSGEAGAPVPQMADSVSAVFDGPRTDVADTTRFFVNGWGAVREIRDALGNETRLTRGNAAYPAFVTRAEYPNDYEVTAQYDADGLLSSTWNNAAGASTAYQWNTTWSRVTRITTPEGVVTAYGYDPATGDRLSVDAGGTVTRYGYNAAGQVTRVTGAAGDVTRLAYSADQGNLASATSPEGHTTTYAHDRAGMRTVTRSPAHAGPAGPVFRVDSLYYDVMGRDTLAVSRSTDTSETAWLKVRTAYDAATGDRLSVIPYADHPVTDSMTTGANRWSYDGLGRVETEQGAGRDSLVYDVAGNVVKRFKLRPAGTPVPVHDALVYDALNRLVERVTPAKFYAGESGRVAPFPYYSPAGLTIRADTATFAYDAAGNLIRADNGYASVMRTYALDGLVATETQRIRRFRDPGIADPGYAQSYALAYGYDRDRRRTTITHPAILGGGVMRYAYAARTGLLSTLTGPGGHIYGFSYDTNGRLSGRTFPGASETLSYDLDGLVTARSMAGSGVPLLSESLTYDHRGKVVRETGSSTDMAYTGLGHLKRMFHSPGIVPRPTHETLEPNGLGLVLRDSTWVQAASDGTPAGAGYPGITVHNASYGPGGRLAGKTAEWAPATEAPDDAMPPGTWTGLEFRRNYDPATGDLLSEFRRREAWVPEVSGDTITSVVFNHTSDAITESRSYYSADGMLRVHQANRATRDGLQTTPHLDTLDGVYEVYWYDALGRRVLKRSIQEHGELCDMRHVTCHDTIERFVWDGSQILAEVRATDASNAAAGGPAGTQTGRIVYVHPGGVDAPAGMVRNGVPYALHANWRGLYAFATDGQGRKAHSRDVEWPANNRRAFLGRSDRRDWVWFGSLVSSGTDASGLLYRRNRYYDPQSGQFTQQDPIGIAGGLNLYGFAGGDPVNNSDPFGLCLEEDEVCLDLVEFLRSLEGDVFQRAATAFDEYRGGSVQLVDREVIQPWRAYLGRVQENGDVWIANDLLRGDYAITAVHESRHLPTDVDGGTKHVRGDRSNQRYFLTAEYQAYQALPNPGPYAANEHYFELRVTFPNMRLIRPLPPRGH